jgi:hypothetical protein
MIQQIYRSLALLTIAVAAPAQVMDIYNSPSSDGTYVYDAGVIQYSAGEGCTMCATATHTYQGSVVVTSPSGRQGSCSFDTAQSAASPLNLQCEASIPIDGEEGNFTAVYNPTVVCSMFGTLLNASLFDVIGVGVSATNYKQSYVGRSSCVYSQDCDVTPTCGTAQGYANVTASPPCMQYYLQQFTSVIYTTGRVCYAVPYIPPNYFSGAQNARVPCD